MIPLRDDIPTTIKPVITVTLIVLCVLAFFWQLSLGERGFEAAVRVFGVTPALLFGADTPYHVLPTLTLFSSMFLHGGWMHLIGNMLYLWIFGNNVEDSMGHARFIAFYVLCGVGAAMVQAYAEPGSMIPMIGASGAISGVLGAYLLLYPHARVLVLVPLGFLTRLVRLPAMVVLGFWIILQLINSQLAGSSGGGVAWGAHIGGFTAGMLLIPVFKYRHIPFFHGRSDG